MDDTPAPPDDNGETGNAQLALGFLVGRVLAAPTAMLRERELFLVRLLILARVIADAAAGAAFELYEIFGKFRLCHMPETISPSTIPETSGYCNGYPESIDILWIKFIVYSACQNRRIVTITRNEKEYPMRQRPHPCRLGHLMQQKTLLYESFIVQAEGEPKREVLLSTGEVFEEEAMKGVVHWLIHDHGLFARIIGKRSTLGLKITAPKGRKFRIDPATRKPQII